MPKKSSGWFGAAAGNLAPTIPHKGSISMITDEMAVAAGTEVDHIRGNRKADFVAKDAALDNTAVHPKDEAWLTGAIIRTQTRMALIGQQLGQDVECMKRTSNEKPGRVVEQVDDSQEFFRRKYPSWLWNLQINRCQSVQNLHISECPQQWPLDVADWEPIRDFLCGCKWFLHAEKSTAFVELAYLLLVRDFKLSDVDPDTTSFRQIYERLRKALAFLHRKDYQLFPGIWARCENKNDGKALPAGRLTGAIPYMSNQELQGFAKLLQIGAGKTLRSWSFAVGEVHDVSVFS